MRFAADVYAALILVMQISLPIVLSITVAGVLTGLVQALTQIQDQTLPHAIKLMAAALAILVFGAAMSASLLMFTEQVFSRIPMM